MARIRTVKPELFLHESLFDAEVETGLPLRLAFIGLFCQCDREGRFRWEPRRLKAQILPYEETDFSRVLDALKTRGFVRKYKHDGREYGDIPSWNKHQSVNNRERKSEMPKFVASDELETTSTRQRRDNDACQSFPSGTRNKEGNKEGNKVLLASSDDDDANTGIFMVLNGGKRWTVSQADLDRWKERFPALDVEAELRSAQAWTEDNAAKRKTASGVKGFISRWLARAQNQGRGNVPANGSSKAKTTQFLQLPVEDAE